MVNEREFSLKIDFTGSFTSKMYIIYNKSESRGNKDMERIQNIVFQQKTCDYNDIYYHTMFHKGIYALLDMSRILHL